jgi:hypothetical protein
MGKKIYLSDQELRRIEMLLIDLTERADLTKEDEKDVRRIIEKLNK